MPRFERNRNKVKKCPCGKSNYDGKFSPHEGSDKSGYCFACSKYFPPFEGGKYLEYIPEYKTQKVSFIDKSDFERSLNPLNRNNFVDFLIQRLGINGTQNICNRYFIGSSKKWENASIFWYLDKSFNVTTGKIMQYDRTTGKRVKTPFNKITWVHTELKITRERIKKVFFGEHLTSLYPNNPIALVESEKTACIASEFFPNIIWLASGGIANLTIERLKSLKGRQIFLFPDLGAYKLWTEKANELSKWFNIYTSDYLEKNANTSELNQKLDLADFILSKINTNIGSL